MIEWHRHYFRAYGSGVVLDRFEGRYRLNQLPTAPGKSARCNPQNLCGPAGKEHVLWFHPVEMCDLLRHFVVLPEWIPVDHARGGPDGLSYSGGWTIGILIAVQVNESIWSRGRCKHGGVSGWDFSHCPGYGHARGGANTQGAKKASARTDHAYLVRSKRAAMRGSSREGTEPQVVGAIE